ncbi:hypothetical protein JCM10207_008706 [Rhodosporidiobolus poonsookiae]
MSDTDQKPGSPSSPVIDRASSHDSRSPSLPNGMVGDSPALRPPLNYIVVVGQFVAVVVLFPYHLVKYAVFPSSRPRRRWTVLEAATVPAVRRIMRAMDSCGFKISVRDPFVAPINRFPLKLRDVKFEWVESIPDDLVGGIIDDKFVAQRDRVGMYSWRRPDAKRKAEGQGKGGLGEGDKLVGLFFHGGAYTHNSAHPSSPSSVIPATLFKKAPRFSSMHSTEYRLLPHYPFPAALQDCAAVYVSLLRRGVKGHQIILIGDSSGGHLALALARWAKDILKSGKGNLRDEGEGGKDGEKRQWRMEEPGGLILFSPWTDPSHSYLDSTPETYVPRKNDCDYLFEEGPFRHHIVDSLLGSHEKEFVLSPYISPGAPLQDPAIFADFPPTFVHYGTGERCMAEGMRLVEKMQKAGVMVDVTVTEDTVHDIMLLAKMWNKKQIQQVWDGAFGFVKKLDGKEGRDS